jgi:hypothetical protein
MTSRADFCLVELQPIVALEGLAAAQGGGTLRSSGQGAAALQGFSADYSVEVVHNPADLLVELLQNLPLR